MNFVMGGYTLVGQLSRFCTQTGAVASWSHATTYRRISEATAPAGGECGPSPDFALYSLTFTVPLRKYHGRAECFIQRPRSYRTVNAFRHDYKNQSTVVMQGKRRCLF